MRKGRRREDWGGKDTNHGVNMVRMLAEDDYGAISKKKIHKDANGAKEMYLELLKQLFNCDDVKGGFDEDRKLVMGFVV